jgi:hypothetical protein
MRKLFEEALERFLNLDHRLVLLALWLAGLLLIALVVLLTWVAVVGFLVAMERAI